MSHFKEGLEFSKVHFVSDVQFVVSFPRDLNRLLSLFKLPRFNIKILLFPVKYKPAFSLPMFEDTKFPDSN